MSANEMSISDTAQILEKIKAELLTLLQINQTNCQKAEFILPSISQYSESPFY